MLLLLFEIGSGRYALDTSQIIEIVPLVTLKKIPATPDYISGLMNYRGEGIPVVDLCQLVDNSFCDDALSTRIIIVNYHLKNDGYKPLGLIANDITETVRSEISKPPSTGVLMDRALYDEESASETADMIQWFDLKKFLPENEIALLYAEEE